MANFEIAGFSYMSRPMDAMTQFKVARRLAPVLSVFSEFNSQLLLMKAPDGDADPATASTTQKEAANRMIDLAGKAIGQGISDEATEFIIAACLSLCQRRKAGATGQGDVWSEVWNFHTGQPQHLDINMGVILQICINVLKDNLGSFFPGRLSHSKE